MEQEIYKLADELLQLTQRIHDLLTNEESEPNDWLTLLDDRESIMAQINQLVSAGAILDDSHKQLLLQGYQLNQRMIPLMKGRQQGVRNKIAVLQKGKMAVNSYNEVGPSGYGAFFDRKK